MTYADHAHVVEVLDTATLTASDPPVHVLNRVHVDGTPLDAVYSHVSFTAAHAEGTTVTFHGVRLGDVEVGTEPGNFGCQWGGHRWLLPKGTMLPGLVLGRSALIDAGLLTALPDDLIDLTAYIAEVRIGAEVPA